MRESAYATPDMLETRVRSRRAAPVTVPFREPATRTYAAVTRVSWVRTAASQHARTSAPDTEPAALMVCASVT